MDVFLQRLRQEYKIAIIATAPSVPVKVLCRGDEEEIEVTTPSKFPTKETIITTKEPFVMATIFSPREYFGDIQKLCMDRRGVQEAMEVVENRIQFTFKLPLAEVIFDFFDKLKSISSGYATFDYGDVEFEESDIVKVQILLNGEPADPLSVIVHRSKAEKMGRDLCVKLKETLRRQQFEIRIQAAIHNKIIARETIKPFRKDVTAKCYGGDVSRKRKLLEKQKEGKKRMRSIGEVEVSQETFMAVTKLGKD